MRPVQNMIYWNFNVINVYYLSMTDLLKKVHIKFSVPSYILLSFINLREEEMLGVDAI